MRVVVLISGAGSNLRALLDATAGPASPVQVVAVGADRDAEGLAHAAASGVPTFVVPFRRDDREGWGHDLLAAITPHRADLVVLSGFMRLLPAHAVDALAPRLVNTHPAYLPEFPGAHAVRDAITAGVRETGASVIVVDHGVDTGPLLARERVPVLPHDTEAELHERIKRVERRLLADVLADIAAGRIGLEAQP